MKNLWCWRCKMEVPMLDDDEYLIAYNLYREAFDVNKSGIPLKQRFKPLLEYYKEVSGFEETIPNAIMHHKISMYGPPCEKCGKPYRTPKASFCAACGNKRR